MLPAVLISGPAASGKSTLGAALAARLGAALLDQDVLTGPLTSVVGALVGSDDLDDPELAGRTRAARYETLLASAVDNLRVGRPVVVVAPFTAERADPAAWAAVRNRLVAAGGSPVLVWLRLDPGELLRRIRARAESRDRGKLTDPAAFLAGGALAPPRAEHLVLDAACPVERLARTLETFLSPCP